VLSGSLLLLAVVLPCCSAGKHILLCVRGMRSLQWQLVSGGGCSLLWHSPGAALGIARTLWRGNHLLYTVRIDPSEKEEELLVSALPVQGNNYILII
jgi:hypothetical protein